MFLKCGCPVCVHFLLFVRSLHFPTSWPIRRMKHPETSGRSRHRPSPTASGPGARDCRRALRAVHWNMAGHTRAIRGLLRHAATSRPYCTVPVPLPLLACCPFHFLLFPLCFASRRGTRGPFISKQTKSNTRITERMNERKTPQT